MQFTEQERNALGQVYLGPVGELFERLQGECDSHLRYAEGIARDRLQGKAQLIEELLREMRTASDNKREATGGQRNPRQF